MESTEFYFRDRRESGQFKQQENASRVWILMDIVVPAASSLPVSRHCTDALYIIRSLQLTILALKVWHEGPCLGPQK